MVDNDGGVTVLKQGLGSLVYDVSKASGWLRIKTHVEIEMESFGSKLSSGAVLCSKGV